MSRRSYSRSMEQLPPLQQDSRRISSSAGFNSVSPRRSPTRLRYEDAGRRRVSSPTHADRRKVTRRYFFEGTPGPAGRALPSAHHYDVFLDGDEGTEGTEIHDHMTCRYVDFLTQPVAQNLRHGKSVDISELRSFLMYSRPRTRLDAYPLWVLAKDLLRSLLTEKLDWANKEAEQLRVELAAAFEKISANDEDKEQMGREWEAKLKAANDAAAKERAMFEAKQGSMQAQLDALMRDNARLLAQTKEDALSLAAAKGELQQSLAEREDMLRRAAMEAEAAAAKGASMTEEERMALLLDSMSELSPEARNKLLQEMLSSMATDDVLSLMSEAQRQEALQKLLKIDGWRGASFLRGCARDEVRLEKAACGAVMEAVGLDCDKEALLDAISMSPEEMLAALKTRLGDLDAREVLKQLGLSMEGLAGSAPPAEDSGGAFDMDGLLAGLSEEELEALRRRLRPELSDETTQTEAVEAATQAGGGDGEEVHPHKGKKPGLLHHDSKVLHFFTTVPLKMAPMPPKSMRKTIDAIYEAKAKADKIDDGNSHPRAAFPEFIEEFLIDKYGLKSLADKHLSKIVASVRKYSEPTDKHYDKRIALFGVVSGAKEPSAFQEADGDFVIDTLAKLYPLDQISEMLDRKESAVPIDKATNLVSHEILDSRTTGQHGSKDAASEAIAANATEIFVVDPKHPGKKLSQMVIGVDTLLEVGFKAYCGLVAVEDGRLKALYTDFDKDGLARPLPRPQQCTGLALAAQFVMSAMSQFKLRPRVTCEATCRVQSAAWQRR